MRKVKIEELSVWDGIGIIIKRLIIILFLVALGVTLIKCTCDNNINNIIETIKTFFIIDLSISSVANVSILLFCIILWISVLVIIIYKIISSVRWIYSVVFNTIVKCIDENTGEVAYVYREKLQSNSYYIPIDKSGDDNNETSKEEQIQK